MCYKNKTSFQEITNFPLRIQTKVSDTIFFVPIDYVQETITALFQKQVENKTYHITGHTEITTPDISKVIKKTLKVDQLELMEKVENQTELEELFHRFASDLLPYFSSKALFDQTNVENALGKKVLDWKMDYPKLELIIKSYYEEYFGLK